MAMGFVRLQRSTALQLKGTPLAPFLLPTVKDGQYKKEPEELRRLF
ncbi:hypothetical protein Desgi_0034 [Desulfoscipio gibsoniae DSM 7213]|uniref:Uncharacterized protein n=1 Tax=Desulfoscipio gibsoniae DSM 7213 TaxID=767817 RepID=R4KGL2_9FIRM|nr:hypothetical protein Desgi_0034 [Desulfoscipio gibsoniae DSM 7213]